MATPNPAPFDVIPSRYTRAQWDRAMKRINRDVQRHEINGLMLTPADAEYVEHVGHREEPDRRPSPMPPSDVAFLDALEQHGTHDFDGGL